MTTGRPLHTGEIDGLLHQRGSDKRYEPRNCKSCLNQFTPKRSNQVFCSERCRERYDHISGVRELDEETGRECLWCGIKLPEEKKTSARYCSDKCRALAFKAKPCVYCGEIADTRDHFVPQAFVRRMEDLGWIKKRNIIVPACRECNSTAGDRVFNTLTEKRKFIHDQYKKKYKKLLDMPYWTEGEMSEYGFSLKSHLRHNILALEELKARLRWPRIIK